MAFDSSKEELEQVYKAYIGKSEGLESRVWVKLLKETKVIGKSFTTTDADLIFTKVKAKGSKGIDFNQFVEALKLVTQKKKVEEVAMIASITSTEGPTFTGTRADSVRLHDDKASYTGVHAHGGPSTIDTKGKGTFGEFDKDPHGTGGHQVKLENLCDRSAATIRGLNNG